MYRLFVQYSSKSAASNSFAYPEICQFIPSFIRRSVDHDDSLKRSIDFEENPPLRLNTAHGSMSSDDVSCLSEATEPRAVKGAFIAGLEHTAQRRLRRLITGDEFDALGHRWSWAGGGQATLHVHEGGQMAESTGKVRGFCKSILTGQKGLGKVDIFIPKCLEGVPDQCGSRAYLALVESWA